MNYFVRASEGSRDCPRVHPLLLSLTAAFAKSDNSPDIGSVADNDPRTLRDGYYTSPSDLPPLNIHFPGQNGAAYLLTCADLRFLLSSIALCEECMFTQPQVNAGAVEEKPNSSIPVAEAELVPPGLVENLAGTSDSAIGVRTKGKKRRRASSGGVNGESCRLMALFKRDKAVA